MMFSAGLKRKWTTFNEDEDEDENKKNVDSQAEMNKTRENKKKKKVGWESRFVHEVRLVREWVEELRSLTNNT